MNPGRLPAQTGSKVHRMWMCPASVILPQNVSDDSEARSEPARGKGHVVHKYLERVRAVGPEEALAGVPEDCLILCKALDIDRLPTHLSTEVAFAWNWVTQTARELGRNLGHRDYDLLRVDWSCEIPCTIDVVGSAQVIVGGFARMRGYVGDYKTGHTSYPRPNRFGQTMLGALCARSVLGLEDCIVELIHIDDDGDSWPARDLVDEWDMDTFARELTETMESLPALVEAYDSGLAIVKHEGSHCAYCPGFKDCSAKVGLIRSIPVELVKLGIAPGANGELEVAPNAITVRNAAMAYEACERIEAILRKVRAEVCGIAYHEPIPLSDGRVIERYTHKRRAVDGRIAAAVLEERYGRAEAMTAVDIKVSIDGIRDVVVRNIDPKAKPRPKIETKKGDGLLDLVLRDIEGRGGLATNVGEECKPHMPRKAKLPAGGGSR
ncbi:MAG TPA: hypothetical protein VJZ73_13340 [Methylomirabilota bacterium]|nr:hypothetical protein [Methylomirabilota bacterium]